MKRNRPFNPNVNPFGIGDLGGILKQYGQDVASGKIAREGADRYAGLLNAAAIGDEAATKELMGEFGGGGILGMTKKAASLPLDEASRMARAKEMGFDVDRPLYHGTADDITEFDIKHPNRHDWGWIGEGVYVSDSPEVASSYANLKKGAADPNVMPLLTSASNPKRITMQEKHKLFQKGPEAAEAFKAQAMSDGYDAIEVMTPKGELLEMNVFDPSQIRSRFATFDTSKKDSANILAGGLLGTLGLSGGYGLLSQDDYD